MVKVFQSYFQKFLIVPFTMLIVFSGSTFGQGNSNYVDSLNQVLTTSENDTTTARTYVRLAEAWHVIDLDTMASLCESALQIADRNLKLKLSEKENLSFLMTRGDCMNNLGYYAKYHGDIQKALDYYHSALIIDKQIGNKIGLGFDLNNIGMIYRSQGDMEKTLTCMEMSLELFREVDFLRGVSTLLDNLSGTYNSFDPNNEKSVPYAMEALRIREEMKDSEGIVISLNGLGNNKRALDFPEQALEYFNRAYDLSDKVEYNLGKIIALKNITEYHCEQEDWNRAEEFGLEALELAQKEGAVQNTRDVSVVLRQIYKAQKDPVKELAMFSLYVQMKDSVDNIKNREAVYRAQVEYEYETKKVIESKETEQKIQLAEEQKNHQVFISSVVGIGLLLVVFIAFLLYTRWKLSQKQKGIIENQLEELAKSNREKVFMMKEIHHRVKNNFQAVNSLLRFQSFEFDDPHIINMFEACQNRILSMSLVHEEMYRSERFTEVNTRKHLTRLVNELVPQNALGKEIKLEVNIEEMLMGTKTLIPLGLIINEFVTNSLKHAFTEMESGIIFLSLKKIDASQFELIFRDNGLGYKTKIDKKTTGSIGLELISVFSEQLEGELHKIEQDKGTCYRLVFNNQDY